MEIDTAGDSNPSNGRLQSPNLNELKILEFQRADKSESYFNAQLHHWKCEELKMNIEGEKIARGCEVYDS